ncbi:MAG: hypothetical protein ACE366_11610 [Bradymonadia bacterium]
MTAGRAIKLVTLITLSTLLGTGCPPKGGRVKDAGVSKDAGGNADNDGDKRPDPENEPKKRREDQGRFAERLCREDMLVVDVPTFIPNLWVKNGRTVATALVRQDEIRKLLEEEANQRLEPWFGDPTGAKRRIHVTLERVFAANSYSGVPLNQQPVADRADPVHLRHLRFTFTSDTPTGRAPENLRPSAQCEALATLQILLDDAIGAEDAARLYVARACDASIQQSATFAPAPHDEWHLTAMGIDQSSVRITGASGSPSAHVAIVDTLPPQKVVSLLGAESPDGVDATPGTMHGAAMGLYVRQVSPTAKITFFKGLSGDGASPIGDLATALQRVHTRFSEASRARAPLVVNLSLGWKADGRVRTSIKGSWTQRHLSWTDGRQIPRDCQMLEDPVGESVRLALIGLRRRGLEVSTLIYAAAGNTILSPPMKYPGKAPTDDPVEALPDPSNVRAVPPVYATDDLLYPANWARRLTELRPGETPTPLVESVGQSGPRNPDPDHTNFRLETPLVAPGVFVPISLGVNTSLTGVTTWADIDLCTDRSGAVAGPFLPPHYSGTSVSTAFASGTAAEALRALQGRRSSGTPPRVIRQDQMTALMTHSGIPCGQVKGHYLAPNFYDIPDVPQLDGTPNPAAHENAAVAPVRTDVRRQLHFKTLMTLIQQPVCMQRVLACTFENPRNHLGRLNSTCLTSALSACDVPLRRRACAGSKPVLAGTRPELECAANKLLSSVTPAPLPKRAPDPLVAGTLGPQPTIYPCTGRCSVFTFSAGGDRMMDITFELNPKWDVARTTRVELRILGNGGFLAGPAYTLSNNPTSDLSPGKLHIVKDIKLENDSVTESMDFRLVFEGKSVTGQQVSISQPLSVHKSTPGWSTP